jgi:sulfonate transport system substrate-binding protein
LLRGRVWGNVISLVLVLLAFAPLVAHAVRNQPASAAGLPLVAALPETVPPGTTLVVGDPTTQRVLEHTGWIRQLPFQVKWAQITGGPGVTEAFQAKALDVGSAANIPPIHATWVGIPVKIVAFRTRKDPLRHPTYVIGIAPRGRIDTLADLKGKRIAFSPGQAQGAVVLRTLAAAGVNPREVTLVDLPATADAYTGALAANQVDAAPIGSGLPSKRYLDRYASDGAKVLHHGAFRDDPIILYVRTETLRDPAKAAAIRAYVGLWARAQQWIDEHPQEWSQIYYLEDQGLSLADAAVIIEKSGSPEIPTTWDDAIALQQETIDFMARQTGRPRFDARDIFDRRFEAVAAAAIGRGTSASALPHRSGNPT